MSTPEGENKVGLTSEDMGTSAFDLPSLTPVKIRAPLPPECGGALAAIVDDHNRRAMAWRQQNIQYAWASQIEPISQDQVEQAFQLLQHMRIGGLPRKPFLRGLHHSDDEYHRAFCEFVQRPEIQWVHVVRLLILLGRIPTIKHEQFVFAWGSPFFDAFRKSHPGAGGLREIAAAMAAIGLDDLILGRAWLNSYMPPAQWDAKAVWPLPSSKSATT